MAKRWAVFFLLALVWPAVAIAATPNPLCPDSGFFSGKMLTDICWDCMFPVAIGGGQIGTGTVPSGAADETVCTCADSAGVPSVGITLGMWQPAQLMELVRTPGCSMAMGGATLNIGGPQFRGTQGHGSWGADDGVFFHYHKYAAPLLAILGMFSNKGCFGDSYVDFDLTYVSEIDPTWNNSELAFFTNPEAAAIANPIAMASCVVDAVAADTGKPIDSMFWCAGHWGLLYPFSGFAGNSGGLARQTSLLATRAMAALHRRGLAWDTMGNKAVCGGYPDPIFRKSMYRMSMFFPTAEANGNHAIGELPLLWNGSSVVSGSGAGAGADSTGTGFNNVPGVGDDALYVVWRWTDCCMTAF